MVKINYAVILEECMKGLYPPAEVNSLMKTNPSTYVLEFRTVGFHTPRQRGRTEFLASLVNTGVAIAVCASDMQKRGFLAKVDTEFKSRVRTSHEINTPFVVDQFKEQNIKFICLDDAGFVNLKKETYAKFIEVFGEELILIRA